MGSVIVKDQYNEKVYRRSADLLEAEINDELVALEPNRGTCFGFNSVATHVWRKLEQPRNFQQLKAELLEEFDVSDEQCANDLRDLLEQMQESHLIERVSGPSAGG